MKHKHKKKFFYKRFVVLFILLAVVCFSLGASYSNFIYTSSNHRAVEMHMNKLSYNIKVNITYKKNKRLRAKGGKYESEAKQGGDLQTGRSCAF